MQRRERLFLLNLAKSEVVDGSGSGSESENSGTKGNVG